MDRAREWPNRWPPPGDAVALRLGIFHLGELNTIDMFFSLVVGMSALPHTGNWKQSTLGMDRSGIRSYAEFEMPKSWRVKMDHHSSLGPTGTGH